MPTKKSELTAAFLLALGVLEYLVFSDSFSQFFQGDALFYMSHRFRSSSDFFHALYSLDIANWYRPLSSCSAAWRDLPQVWFEHGHGARRPVASAA